MNQPKKGNLRALIRNMRKLEEKITAKERAKFHAELADLSGDPRVMKETIRKLITKYEPDPEADHG